MQKIPPEMLGRKEDLMDLQRENRWKSKIGVGFSHSTNGFT